MSEKMTRLRLPGQNAFRGIQDWGEKTPAEMVELVRRHAAHLRAEAEVIESATDADFQIDLVRGPYVQHHIREVQKSAVSA